MEGARRVSIAPGAAGERGPPGGRPTNRPKWQQSSFGSGSTRWARLLILQRTAGTTAGEAALGLLTEGVRHAAAGLAELAADLDVAGLAGDAELAQREAAAAGLVLALVDEGVPGEVVEVAVLAGDEEAGGEDGGGLAAVAIEMHVAGLVGAARRSPELEQAAAEGVEPGGARVCVKLRLAASGNAPAGNSRRRGLQPTIGARPALEGARVLQAGHRIQRGKGATGTPTMAMSSADIQGPVVVAWVGGATRRWTCSPTNRRTSRSRRSSAMVGQRSMFQSSRPMIMAEMCGRSTTAPMPYVYRSWLGRSSPSGV